MKIVLIYSGGLDSTTLLYKLLDEGHEVHALSIDYGQRHRRELEAAQSICADLGVDWFCADLSSLRPLLAGSSQTDDSVEVPEGHYEEESMRLTVVPNRNALMLAVATAWAISLKADAVTYGAHAGDHAVYPDCREEFAEAQARVMKLADWHPVELMRPFVEMTKADIVALGETLDVPFKNTYSCYKGGALHCSKCGTCTERQESFAVAGVIDPTEYL